MALQTTYSENLPTGYAGMVANGETSNRIARTCEDAAGIGFGLPVSRGSGDHGCTGTTTTLANFLGFSIAAQDLGLTASDEADEYQQYDTVNIMTKGAIYVEVTGAVDAGDALTIGIGAGAADGIGDTAADATHIATGWVADETITDGICRIVKR